MPKKSLKKADIVRSSAAEYLTFIAATGDDKDSIEMRYEDENIWLTQKMMAELYGVETSTINEHIKNIFDDHELDKTSTIRKFRIVQKEGSRKVSRDALHYNLQMIIAVGFKVNNQRAVRFRAWANQIVEEYTIKGWTMDVDRLKNSGSILTVRYFEEQLERIREIRLSERMFYLKITDIFTTALDYDPKSKQAHDFFAKVQNKLHFAVHGNTAAEVIYNRADANKSHMGLTTWKDAPRGKIHKFDVIVAKNYLSEKELQSMARIVNAYLDVAEEKAEQCQPMTMEDWEKNFDGLLKLTDREILQNAGKISAEIAEKHALTEFEKYRIVQDHLFENDFERFVLKNLDDDNLKQLEQETKDEQN